MDLEAFKEVLTTLPKVISTLKQVKDMLPDGTKKDEATKNLEQAERQLKIAEAQAAKSLGYHLCQCTFPPQIMVFIHQEKHYKCPKCGNVLDTSSRGDYEDLRTKSRWVIKD